jgi:putative heme transporter
MKWRRYLPLAIGLIAVVVIFAFVLPKIADYGSVWDSIKTLTWPEALLLAVLTAVNIATYAPPLMAALPGLRYVPALTVTLASTASTYVAPGGAAVGMGLTFAMLRAWRFNAADVTLAVTLNSVWNQLFQFGTPALALGLLTLEGTRQHGLLLSMGLIGLGVFIIGAGSFAAALSSGRLARRLGDWAARITTWALRFIRRGPVGWDGASLEGFRGRAMLLLGRRWLWLTLATIAGQIPVFLLLLATLRIFEVPSSQVSLIEAFAAWTVGRLIGSLPFAPPGGIGLVEVGLTGLLIGFGGGAAEVTAAVLVYRALTIVPTLAIGSLAGLTYRRQAGASAAS